MGLVKLLLEHKAFVDHKDSTGSTPLHRAASAGKSESVKVCGVRPAPRTNPRRASMAVLWDL